MALVIADFNADCERLLRGYVLLDERDEFLFEFGGHRQVGVAVGVGQVDRAAVRLNVLQTGRTIADVMFESRLRLRIQFTFDELEQQPVGVAAAVAAEVQDSVENGSEL